MDLSHGAALGLEQLTPRGRDVLALITEGMCDKDIGARLGIHERTVKQHVMNARIRLGLESGGRLRVRLANVFRKTTGVMFAPPPSVKFTPRETQIVELAVRGYTNRTIAMVLSIPNCQTVKNHMRAILLKAGMDTRSELAAWYWAHCVPES